MKLSEILAFLANLITLGSQIASNQGAKIPLKASEIKQKSENAAAELKENGIKDDDIPYLKSFRDRMRWVNWKKAIKQLKRLIDGGAVITNIKIDNGYLRIYYVDPFEQCSTWWQIKAK